MKLRKYFALILSAILLCTSVSTSAFAETTSYIQNGISPYYQNAMEVESYLYISSNSAECTSMGTGLGNVVQISVEQTLQKFWGLWIWNDVDGASWSATENGNAIAITRTKSGLASGKYRVKSVFKLTNSDGETETITIYSTTEKVE